MTITGIRPKIRGCGWKGTGFFFATYTEIEIETLKSEKKVRGTACNLDF